MNKSWVDFDQVKRAVSMRTVLDHYGINWLRSSGKELRGKCPIPNHQRGSDSFQVNLGKNVFKCFSCRAEGNVLDFVVAMEQCTIRDAALKLQEWFSVPQAAEQGAAKACVSSGQPTERAAATGTQLAAEKVGENDEPNKPLNFQLKGIDSGHPYLEQRGITQAVADEFGVGFFPGKGSMAGRVVIPVHDQCGGLVAYGGRSIDGSEPKYKFPVGFKKSHVLFNLSRVKTRQWGNDLDGLVVVVEGFFDCMKVHQAGMPAVALMGCSLSEHQGRLIAENFVEVLVMLDGDSAGREAAPQIAGRLASKVWVKDLVLPDGKQPDQLSTVELNQLFNQVL